MTAQIPDILFYRGEAHEIHQEPLLPYLSESRVHLNCLPGPTNNYRGYTVEWIISNQRLYFSEILGAISENGKPLGFEEVFPGRIAPVFAEWFSGRLTYSEGAHLGTIDTYRRIRTRTIILQISKGQMTGAAEFQRTKEEFDNLLKWEHIYLKDIDIPQSILDKLIAAAAIMVIQVAEMPEDFLRHELSLTDEEVRIVKYALESRGLSLGSDLDGTYYSRPLIYL